LLVDQSDGVRDNLSVSISCGSAVLVVTSFLFALVVSITSGLVQVLQSLVGVVQGGFSLGDVAVNAGQFGLDVSQIGVSDVQGDDKEVSGGLVGLDSLVFSESFQIEGFGDLVEQLVAQLDDSSDGTLISQLGGLGGDGGEDLEQLGIGLSVDELADSLGVGLEVLLDQSSAGSGDLGFVVDFALLDERGTFDVVGEESSGFGDNGSGFLVFSDLFLEDFGLLGSGGVNLVDGMLVFSDLSLLGLLDGLVDLSLGVELALESGFELDSLGVALGDFVVVGSDVHVA
jgi:hypothetical protein